jgi:NitT/TauT family transport system substrate-binding protein
MILRKEGILMKKRGYRKGYFIKRHWQGIFLTIFLGTSIILLSGGIASSAEVKTLKPFTFILDFMPYGEFTPYFTALDKGWYKEEGLDVKILRGFGSGDTVKRIAAGQGDAGSAEYGAVVAARANQDAKVTAIAAYLQQTWLSIFVREGEGINSIRDLKGKTVATTPGNAHQVMFPIVAKLSGIEPDAVKWVVMDGAAMGPALIMKQVDAAPFAHVHEARLQKQAKEQGVKLKRLSYKDFGLDLYALVIFTRGEKIAKESDTLRAFLRATIRGARYALDPKNIEEGAKILLKHNPTVDLYAAIGAAQVVSQYVFADEVTSGKVAVGQFNHEKVRRGIDIYTQYLELKRKVTPEEVYTNDFLPERK